MASDFTSFSFALKDRYTATKVENLTTSDRPLLAMLKKDESFQGDALHVPLIHSNPQGIAGSSLSVAQGNATNVVGKKFQLTVGTINGSVSIGDKVIKASRGNEGAFLRNKVSEIDGLYEQMADNISTYLYSNGGNSLGRIATGGISGAVFTLAEPSSVVNFEVGMQIVLSANDGSDTAHTVRAGSSAIVAIDRQAGTITISNAGDITGETALDYIFREGDFIGNTGVTMFTGVAGFLWPDNAPPVLYGMTRTSDPVRLAGAKLAAADIAGRNIEERLQLLGSAMTGRLKGPGADKVLMNPEDWQNLAIALSTRVRHGTETSVKFGLVTIEFVMGGKMVSICPDRFCPKGTAFALRLQNWTLHSMGKLIQAIDVDGLTVLRASDSNDYEHRLISYPALCTNAPGYSGRVSLT